MRDVPPELDRMLWSVAESNDPRAIEEFGQRYPALRSELGSRVQLVRTLKGARPLRDVPALELPATTPGLRFGRPFGFAAAAAVLATMALAAAVTFQGSQSKQATLSGAETSAYQKTGSSPTVKGLTRAPDSPPTSPPGQQEPLVQRDVRRSPSISFETEESSLKAVIREIAKQGGFEVVFAPGFVDDKIAASYVEVTAGEALADLGQNFGFTALPQEGRKLLILPAVDPSEPPTALPNGSHSIPVEKPAEGSATPPVDGLVQKK